MRPAGNERPVQNQYRTAGHGNATVMSQPNNGEHVRPQVQAVMQTPGNAEISTAMRSNGNVRAGVTCAITAHQPTQPNRERCTNRNKVTEGSAVW